MTFSRAKSGGWVTGERLTAAQMNTIDVNMTRALDGYAGGSFAPSAAIKMGAGTFEINGIGESSGEFTYVNGSSVATPKARTLIMGTGGLMTSDSHTGNAGMGLTLTTSNGHYYFTLPRLPTGAVISTIEALVQPGTAEALVADRMSLLLTEVDGDDFDAPSTGLHDQKTPSVTNDRYDDGTANLQVITVTYESPGDVVTVGANPFVLDVGSGDNAAASNDELHGFRITWTDPGPRNY